MIEHLKLAPYEERYAVLEMEPLRITLELLPGGRIVQYDPVMLDNLLARCVVNEATQRKGLPDTPAGWRLPTPLTCLWRDAEGLPLWAATVFRAVGPWADDIVYHHKRMQSGRWTGTRTGKFAPSPVIGRWKERRVPKPLVVCDTWEAECIGNAEEIARLLAQLRYIGKHRNVGYGAIYRWRIDSIPEFSMIHNGKLARPLPAEAAAQLGLAVPAPLTLVGWTPPQWKPSLWREGWRAGEAVRG